MKKLILYCSGGLCNRLFPLSSAINYAKDLGRELLVYWPLDNSCSVHFNDLFLNNINFVDCKYLNCLQDSNTNYFATNIETVMNELNFYSRPFLSTKLSKIILTNINRNTNKENLLIAHNYFFNEVGLKENYKTLLNFQVLPKILKKENELADFYKLDKNVIGIHARGAAMGSNFTYWTTSIQKYLNQEKKIYISSDEQELEDTLVNEFPIIIRRERKEYVSKINPNEDWNYKSNNVFMSPESIVDAIIDALLLARTDLRVFKENSTFSQYIKVLGG